MKPLLALMALLTLSACAADPARLAEMDREKCRSYGMKPGTETFANCRMTLDVERRRENRRALDDAYFASRIGPYGPYGPYLY
ncbi:hypothetical protein ACFQI3_15220 [Hansschlegelia quercus]|uniref:Lipoprotein n=1 Tax=Hansschlegelia quercus TaxID=2528245 RepID=A0A4Q9GHY7_9HYPH|nr:hypothetical protein [Hansschlegelia quercus]TBN48306.1 hypothetical protein EYR15_14640 [Hansschlegelia quercus]